MRVCVIVAFHSHCSAASMTSTCQCETFYNLYLYLFFLTFIFLIINKYNLTSDIYCKFKISFPLVVFLLKLVLFECGRSCNVCNLLAILILKDTCTNPASFQKKWTKYIYRNSHIEATNVWNDQIFCSQAPEVSMKLVFHVVKQMQARVWRRMWAKTGSIKHTREPH